MIDKSPSQSKQETKASDNERSWSEPDSKLRSQLSRELKSRSTEGDRWRVANECLVYPSEDRSYEGHMSLMTNYFQTHVVDLGFNSTFFNHPLEDGRMIVAFAFDPENGNAKKFHQHLANSAVEVNRVLTGLGATKLIPKLEL